MINLIKLKILYSVLTLTFTAQVVHSQQRSAPCLFDQKSLVDQKKIEIVERRIQEGIENLSENRTSDTAYVIPVVVHVIHEGGPENISEAQVQSAIDVLNEDFRKIAGTAGDGAGVDTEMQFCLANIDPNGNCTNGIVRINSSLTNHVSYERPLLKQLSFWDNLRYLNIYVVKGISGGTLGYSSFPGGPADEDGIVIEHSVFGRIGTASGSLGRTTTHEAGHWLGIYHTFQDGCGTDVCTDGDLVCDTPPVSTANFGCPSAVNSCSNDSPDLVDQIENYMDYTNDACKSMFTEGQRLRMESTMTSIRTEIWDEINLIATGCDTDYVAPPSCPVVANFSTLTPEICVDGTISFTDISLNDPTAWTWYFEGGTPATSTLQNPSVSYSSTGTYDVKLVVTDGVDSDSLTLTDFVTITLPGVGNSLPYIENFDSGVWPPTDMTIFNADGGLSWELDSLGFNSPGYSARINNLINTNYGTIDELILPYLDLTTNGSTPYFKISFAYAKSNALYTDEMIVQISVDCGNTWDQIMYKAGSLLATGPTQTTPFIPTASQWKTADVSLAAYETEQYALIKIMNVTDGGNNLYVDDITVGDADLSINNIVPTEFFTVYPNPSHSEITVEFSSMAKGELVLLNAQNKVLNELKMNNENKLNFSVSDLAAGIYFLRYIDGAQEFSRRIIIL